MTNVEIAKALFEALAEQNDPVVRRLCAPDMRVRQNNAPAMTLDALLAFNAAVGSVVKDFRYEDAVRSETATEFVEEHAVRGVLPNGQPLNLAACVVSDVIGGKVADVREYVDTAAAAELIAALG
ncbi:MAG: nuclear transport factor 2 family protein [Alphaproteobacteria bacterium]|nr:nuclear transport factor 2 family protein [Alphaproteobacteria bacterium]